MRIVDYIITSGGGALIIGILTLLFKTSIKKEIERSIDYSYDKKLENHKAQIKKDNDLEIKRIESQLNQQVENARLYLSQYSQKQFEYYNELWISLAELKFSMDKLWENADIKNLKDLVSKHKTASNKRILNAVLLEPRHFEECGHLLEQIERFQFGKQSLIGLRKRNYIQNVSEEQINDVILSNGNILADFSDYLDQFRLCIQRQIKGEHKKENESTTRVSVAQPYKTKEPESL